MLAAIQRGVGSAVSGMILFLPKLALFIVVFVIGWIIAAVLQRITNAILERVGFDRLVERGGVKKALSRSKYDASDLLGKIVYYIVLLFTLELAFGVFGPNPVSAVLTGIIAYLPNVFVAGLVVIIAAAIAAAVREVLDAAVGGLTWGRWVASGAAVAILAVGVFAALTQLRIAPLIVTGLFYALLAAVVGIAVVAVGGGGIQPMRQYWGRALDRVATEMPQAGQGAGDRIQHRMEERKQQAKETVGAGQRSGSSGGGNMPPPPPPRGGMGTPPPPPPSGGMGPGGM